MKTIQHKFVEFVPDSIEEGIIYISVEYKTAVHLCTCGCGNKVVTPLSPTDWEIRFNGKTISLNPSIGNWNFSCKSHYWITNNQVWPASLWKKSKIIAGRKQDARNKKRYYKKNKNRES